MPEYTYICENGHERSVIESMVSDFEHPCPVCGGDSWRKPQMPAVNWGGLAPSDGEQSPVIKSMLETKDQRRDWFEKMHEEHEKETTNV